MVDRKGFILLINLYYLLTFSLHDHFVPNVHSVKTNAVSHIVNE